MQIEPPPSPTRDSLSSTTVNDGDLLPPTHAQNAILAAWARSSEGATHFTERPEAPGTLFWQMTMGLVGLMLLVTGTVLMFFFAGAGVIALATGGGVTALAFGGAGRTSQRQQDSGE